jgi:hypothetical protein
MSYDGDDKAPMVRSCHVQAKKKNDRDAEFCAAACGLVRVYGGECEVPPHQIRTKHPSTAAHGSCVRKDDLY